MWQFGEKFCMCVLACVWKGSLHVTPSVLTWYGKLLNGSPLKWINDL